MLRSRKETRASRLALSAAASTSLTSSPARDVGDTGIGAALVLGPSEASVSVRVALRRDCTLCHPTEGCPHLPPPGSCRARRSTPTNRRTVRKETEKPSQFLLCVGKKGQECHVFSFPPCAMFSLYK